MIRKHRFAFALLAVLAATLFLAPIAKREVFQFRDHFDYFQPLRWFTATELRAGRLPLWNPYSASGEPWLANPQTGVFYPPAWIHVVLPFDTAYMLFLYFHLVLLAWGMYLLLQKFNSRGAALVGAAAILFSGPVLSLLDVSNNLATLAWLPLVLWCATEGAWRRGGIVLALSFLAGEPFFAGLAAVMYALVRRRRDVLGTAAIAIGLSAVQLLPFLELVRGSDRSGGVMDAAEVLRDSMPLREWLRVVVPPSLFAQPAAQSFIPVVYGGVIVVILALVGLSTLRRRRDLVGWLALLALAVLIAAGPEFLVRLPLTLFRYPSRLIPIAMLALGAIAAAGWDRLRADKRWLDLIIVALVAADLLPRAVPLLATGRFDPHIVPYERSVGASQKFLRVLNDDRQRLASIGGYLNLYDRRFDAFTGAPLISRSYLRSYIRWQRYPRRVDLDAAAIGYVLSSRAMPEELARIARVGGVSVYEIPSPRAMAVSIAGTRVTPLMWDFDSSRARVTSNTTERSTVTIAQCDASGWTVTVDGKDAKKSLFFDVFRAVDVPAGRHEIVWAYRPRALFFGAVMTAITLASLTLSVFVKRWR